MIKLETIPKKEGQKARIESFTLKQAESILKRSKNWKIQDESKYVFKDGSILTKAKKEEGK